MSGPQISNPAAVIVAAGVFPVQLEVSAPVDANPVTITINSVPGYGAVDYFNGTTYVAASAGTQLTSAELTSLIYVPPAAGSFQGGNITYTVADNTNSAQGTIAVSVVDGGAQLYFSAIGAGATGPDLVSVSAAGTVTPDPVRTDPSASFGSFAGEDGGYAYLGGNVYFLADTGGTFDALFQLAPNGHLTQINGATGVSQQNANFIIYNGSLYFTGITSTTVSNDELVRLDPNGTVHTIDSTVSSPGVISGFATFDGDLYFSGIAQGNSNPDLYKLDALGNLTSIPLRTGPNAAFGSFAGEDGGFAVFNGGMFFNAFTDAVGSDALFRLDGNGTVTVVRDGSNNVLFHTSGETSNFEQFDGSLYFTEQGASTFADLYRMDAQGNVTAITVADNGTALDNPGSTGYAQFNGNLYFAATNPASNSAELFVLSPGGNTATLVLDAQSNVLSDAGIDGGFVTFNGILYFNAFDSGLGEDVLYRLAPNGTPTPVLDGQGREIAHLTGDGTNFTKFDGALYFTALTTSDGEELVKLDAAGQVTVTDINPGPSNSSPGASGGFTVFPGGSFTGTAGNDIIVGSPNGHNVISGLAGDDLIFGYSGDIVSGGPGNDTLVMGSTGAIDLSGVTGVEIIALSSGASNIVTLTDANFGPSTINPSDSVANMVVYAGNSGDSIDAAGLSLAHTVTLVGGSGNNILSGGLGNDTLISGSGKDTLNGGGGFDSFLVNNSNDVVTQIAGGNGIVFANADFTLPAGVDSLIVQGTATHGTGNSDAAGDTLYAVDPGLAAALTGESANDTFVVYDSSDVVIPKAGSHDVVYAAANYTLPTGVDTLILEGTATQGTGNNDATGDTLIGGNPNVAVTLTGNSANDTFAVYNASDVVAAAPNSHDTIYSAVNFTLPTGIATLILEGAATQGVGNNDAAGDTLIAGNPNVVATLAGHSASDTFAVYNSADTVIGQAGSNDTVFAAANFTLPTNVDTLFLEGNATLGTANNDAHGDTLYGNATVASTLVGGTADDILNVIGTAGTTLTGGGGSNTFVLPANFGADTITDFKTTGGNADVIQFSSADFTSFNQVLAAATDLDASHVQIVSGASSVTLDGHQKVDLVSSNFHFV